MRTPHDPGGDRIVRREIRERPRHRHVHGGNRSNGRCSAVYESGHTTGIARPSSLVTAALQAAVRARLRSGSL